MTGRGIAAVGLTTFGWGLMVGILLGGLMASVRP